MSKYDTLWAWIAGKGEDTLILTYEQIGEIAGVPIDHSFLRAKKELTALGYEVVRISMKDRTVRVRRMKEEEAP